MTYTLYYIGYNSQKIYIDGMRFSDEETARRWALMWKAIGSLGRVYIEEEGDETHSLHLLNDYR